MNGAKTDPCDKTNNPPIQIIINMTGKSHNFFLVLRNVKSSIRNFMSLD